LGNSGKTTKFEAGTVAPRWGYGLRRDGNLLAVRCESMESPGEMSSLSFFRLTLRRLGIIKRVPHGLNRRTKKLPKSRVLESDFFTPGAERDSGTTLLQGQSLDLTLPSLLCRLALEPHVVSLSLRTLVCLIASPLPPSRVCVCVCPGGSNPLLLQVIFIGSSDEETNGEGARADCRENCCEQPTRPSLAHLRKAQGRLRLF